MRNAAITARAFKQGRKTHRRRGNILVLTAFLMIGLMGILALSIDVGFVYTMQTELARSVDSAALAGARSMVDGEDAANASVVEYLVRNPVGKSAKTPDQTLEQAKTDFVKKHGDHLEVKTGHWSASKRTFEANDELPSALSVALEHPDVPAFFGRVLGREKFQIRAESVAIFQPRDIMLALDFSASMNDDSELSAISALGKDAVEENLKQIWEDLGSPTFGKMGFEPDWVTIPGATIPVSVTWRGSEVEVVSKVMIRRVQLEFDAGETQTFDVNVTSSTWRGAKGMSGQRINKFVVTLKDDTSEAFDFFNDKTIMRGLGLDSVTYPSQGSWQEYIQYARSHSKFLPFYDASVGKAGYRRKFGVKTLLSFWLTTRPTYEETPFLWKGSAQPVTALKDGVDLFVKTVTTVDSGDRVGLVIYDGVDGEAVTESQLTTAVDGIAKIVRHRQAGHYSLHTNVGAGIDNARKELLDHGRKGASKMIVVMTDGRPNWHDGAFDEEGAIADVLAQAAKCKAEKIPILAISFGAGADSSLMAQVASLTNGAHFHVPGGLPVDQYSEELAQAFKAIAEARPLKLVK